MVGGAASAPPQRAGLELPRGVHSFLTGAVGTGIAWPSAARGTPPLIASNLEVSSLADAEEKNRFTLIDLSQHDVTVQLFRWRHDEPGRAIDTLTPYHTSLQRGTEGLEAKDQSCEYSPKLQIGE